ncbi:MAG: DUF5596 domain-containing protein [Clostridia bacterium]|nr:DUF5596 domain-containing protein [Clostridia bacterium]
MKYCNEHFKLVEERLGFPQEAVEVFEGIAQKIENSKSFSEKFEKTLNKYMTPKAHDFGDMCDDMKKLAFIYRVKEYSLTLVWLIVASEKVLALYKEKGISEDIFWDSMMDLKYKFQECVDCKEVYGTFVGHWYTGFYELNRFALGRFQFENSTFGVRDEFVTKAGIKIKKGDKTVGFHIPSSGVPLTDEVRLDAYKKAYEFFKDQRRDDGLLIFECGSWLLYEGNREILPEKSNTIKFMNDFEIIESNPKDKFNDAWRVFGKYGYKSAKHWPEDSSMRRAFKNHVLSGGKTGGGHGVIVFDGEKIVR